MAENCLSRNIRIGLIAVGLCLPSTIIGCGSATPGSNEVDKGEAPVVLTVVPVEQRSLGLTFTALGRCEAQPQKQALLTPATEGRVTEILVEQGSAVTAGQPIVQLDTTLAKADIAEKQAARDSLEASLRLIESPPRVEEQAMSRLAVEQAVNAVDLAQALVGRLQPLAARKEIPESQLFDANQALKQAEVQKRTAQAQYDLLVLRPRDEVIAEAQSKIKVAEETLKSAQARMDLQTIRAPIDGVLDRLNCRRGQTIATGNSIGEIVDNREVLAIAWVPVARSQKVRIDQTAHVRGDDMPSAGDAAATQSHGGQVVYVGKVVDVQTGNVSLHVRVDNRDGRLVVGQTLYVDIGIEAPEIKLCVPIEAIHDEGEGPALTVVREGRAVVLHPQQGTTQGGWLAVNGTDLKEGEPVAVAGAYNLPDGTAVRMVTADSTTKSSE